MKSIKHALLGLFGIAGVTVSTLGLFRVPFAESAAKEHWRQAVLAIVAILMLIAGLISLFIYTFDANDFKAQIVQYVKAHKQRDLVLEGDIKVSFFPKLGLNSGKMSLSERNSSKGFASIENTRLYIAWFPLIRKQLEVDRVILDGVHANVIRYKDGSTNFDDLLLHDDNLGATQFDIDGVDFTNSSINLQDEAEGVHLALRDVHLETGRLTDAMPSKLTANFHVEADKPHINGQVKVNSHLFFERKTGHYELANFEGEMAGEAEGINNLTLNFSGTLNGFPNTGLLTLDKLVVMAKGKLNTHTLEASLDIPKLQLNKDKLNGTKFSFNTTLSQADESLKIALLMPAFEFSNKVLQAADLAADLDLRQADRALQAKFNTPLNINLETQQLQLEAIAAKLTLDHPALSAQLAAKISGSVVIDLPAQEINSHYVAKIDDSEIAGSLMAKGFRNTAYTFDVGINTLDVDRYLQADWSQRLNDDAAKFDFSSLKDMRLRGTLHAGEIKFAKIKTSKLNAEIVANQSTLQVAPISANLYGGTLSASLSLSAEKSPAIMLRQNLANIQFGQLLHDAAGDARLTGKGNLALDLKAEGDNIGTWRKTLTGKISLALVHGSLAGINLATALVEGKSLLGLEDSARSHDANFSELTAFSELKTTIEINDGSAHSSEFQLKSPLFMCKGSGEITLDAGNIDYRFDTSISNTLKRQSSGALADMRGINVPMRVNGSYASPSFTLNFGSASGGNSARLVKANLARTTASAATTKQASP